MKRYGVRRNRRVDPLRPTVAPDYRCRFIPDTLEARAELVNLYHLARTAVGDKRYLRMMWAAGSYHNAHPETSVTAAYKDLEGLLA